MGFVMRLVSIGVFWVFSLVSCFVSAQNSEYIYVPSLEMKWQVPSLRENGSVLTLGDIGGYELRWRAKGEKAFRTVIIKGGSYKSWILAGLARGAYEMHIATFDADGLYSDFVPLNYKSISLRKLISKPGPVVKPTPVTPKPGPVKPVPDARPTPDVKPKPVVKPAPVVRPAPDVKPAPVVKPKPVVKPSPVVRPTPDVKPAPVVKPKPVVKPTPVAKPTPVVKPKPVVKPAPVVKPVTDARPTPVGTGDR